MVKRWLRRFAAATRSSSERETAPVSRDTWSIFTIVYQVQYMDRGWCEKITVIGIRPSYKVYSVAQSFEGDDIVPRVVAKVASLSSLQLQFHVCTLTSSCHAINDSYVESIVPFAIRSRLASPNASHVPGASRFPPEPWSRQWPLAR